jgi:hypothetical protein
MTDETAKNATLEYFAQQEASRRKKNSDIARKIAAKAALAAVNEFLWNDPLDWEDLEGNIFTAVHVTIERMRREAEEQ